MRDGENIVEPLQIHRLVHGYQHGHELLAGTTPLVEEEAQLVRRLSDLSGILPSTPDFTPYLTLYPLPVSKFYVVAKTWLDEEAPRSGCVITLSLLVRQSDWATMTDPMQLSSMLQRPKRNALTTFSSTELFSESRERECDFRLMTKNASNFIAKFFAENIKPIVWFDEPEAETATWLIVRSLWPRARADFSVCTYSLQPRNLKRRPFDVMFAPTSVYSRFHKFSRENFINVKKSRESAISNEPWFNTWLEDVFAGQHHFVGSDEWKDLPADTSSISKLFLARQLLTRTHDTPMAGLGLLDLLEAVSPGNPAAYQTWKNEVVDRILEAVSEDDSNAETMRLLYLTAERLSHEPFACVSNAKKESLLTKVASQTQHEPHLAIELAHDSLLAGRHSLFTDGVLQGLKQLCVHESGAKTILHAHQHMISTLITRDPSFGCILFKALESASADLLNELALALSQVDAQTHLAVLLEVLPVVSRDSQSRVLEELLGCTTTPTLSTIFSALISNSILPTVPTLKRVVETTISQSFPEATRALYEGREDSLLDWSFVYAATFGDGLSAVSDILTLPVHSLQFKTRVLADVILCAAEHGLTGSDRQQLVNAMPLLIDALLGPDSSMHSDVEEAVHILLRQVPDMPFARSQLLRDRVGTLGTSAIARELVEASLLSSIQEYITGSIPLDYSLSWVQTEIGVNWLSHVTGAQLQRIIYHHSGTSRDNYARTWSWLIHAPSVVYERANIPVSYVSSCLSFNQWSDETGALWCELLERAKMENMRTYLELCFHALSFAMSHRHLKLSPVVVASFYPVYECVVSGRSGSLREAEGFFGFFSWDKGKELRERLIETYRRSDWPPADLALAAREPDLLRKILKRMSRTWSGGQSYLEKMHVDLRNRNDRLSRDLLITVSRWTHHQDDEWD